MESEPRTSKWRDRTATAVIGLGAAFYLLLFWSQRAPWAPAWFRWMQNGIRHFFEVAMTALVRAFGAQSLPIGWRWAGTSVVMGILLPWLFMALIRRGHPRDIGLRLPNRIGWRILPAGYLLALPALYAMASSPATRTWYRKQLEGRTALALVATYLVVLVAEHFMFHGILLALLRRERRWPVIPPPAKVEGPLWQKALRFLGLAQPSSGETGLPRALRWLGIPEDCLGAMVFQAVMFGICHIGKSPSEALLSFPGGLALGYLAYRGGSTLVPMTLHMATGLTALGFVWMFETMPG